MTELYLTTIGLFATIILTAFALMRRYNHQRTRDRLYDTRDYIDTDLQFIQQLIDLVIESYAKHYLQGLDHFVDRDDRTSGATLKIEEEDVLEVTRNSVYRVYTMIGPVRLMICEEVHFNGRDGLQDYITMIMYEKISDIAAKINISYDARRKNEAKSTYNNMLPQNKPNPQLRPKDLRSKSDDI